MLAIVELPTTRVPSYSTAAWPGATPVGTASSRMVTSIGRRSDLGRHRRAVRAHLDQARPAPGGRRPAQLGRRPTMLPHREVLLRSDRDRVVHRRDVEDVARLAVVGRDAEPQAAALADGEVVGAVVLADLAAAARRRSRRGAVPRRAVQEAGRVAVGDEADVVAVRLLRHREPASRGLGADLALQRVAEREVRTRQLGSGEDAEHVRLVLAVVDRAVQLDPALGPADQAGVVPGADRVETQRDGLVEHGGELDLLVAAQAGVRCATGRVLGDEVVDHILGEPVGEVPDVERDAEHVGGPAGVVGVLLRAAAPGARTE